MDGPRLRSADTRSRRRYHSSAQHEDRLLLISGSYSSSTGWIPTDEDSSTEGPFDIRHGEKHCTIQVTFDLIVVTGGYNTYDYVTQYQLTGDATVTVMTPLIDGIYRA